MKRLISATVVAAFVTLFAGTVMAQTKTITGEQKTVTATIEAIEKTTRSITLKEENGEYVTIVAGPEVTKFDTMKIGDKITVKYYENLILRMKAPGEADTDTSSAAMTKSDTVKPGGTAATQRTITATITHIDPAVPSITFTGPNGWKYSSRVQDKDALKKVKVGDRLDITWTEAMLVSVEAPAK